MTGLALATAASQVDVVARVIAIAGLAVALAGVWLTWYLWRRSGPEIVVRVTAEGGLPPHGLQVTSVEVVNRGRMPAVIREVGLVCWPIVGPPKFIGNPEYWEVEEEDARLPATIAPTDFLALALPDEDRFSCLAAAVAYAIRGDRQMYQSPIAGLSDRPVQSK